MFSPSNYGFDLSAFLGYWPSAAWTWSVYEEDEPRMLLFNDL